MSLVEKMYSRLPERFEELRDRVEALGKTRRFTIAGYSHSTHSLDSKITWPEAFDSLYLPTSEQCTLESAKKGIDFLKTLAPAELLNMKQWSMRHISAMSETKFCLFALQIEFSQVQQSLQFFEYIFYADESDVESLQIEE